jgi:hypothetical protein
MAASITPPIAQKNPYRCPTHLSWHASHPRQHFTVTRCRKYALMELPQRAGYRAPRSEDPAREVLRVRPEGPMLHPAERAARSERCLRNVEGSMVGQPAHLRSGAFSGGDRKERR